MLLIGQPDSIKWGLGYFTEQVPKGDYRLYGYLDIPDFASTQSNNNSARINIAIEYFGFVDRLGELLINHPIDEVIAIYSASEA